MRFSHEGPWIPDELLLARDEGAVIFFCGAGVSRAYAGLSAFWGLTQAVIKELGVDPSDEARTIFDLAQRIEKDEGIVGLVSADRIFGLLEREFSDQDIEQAVAKALRPLDNVDLTAHRVLLDLSKSPDGRIRLITTNFDLLFETADSTLKRSAPPNLPAPRYMDVDGIVHLHGHVKEDYSGAAEKGFVLTSSNFGRAYLSDGWATRFIRDILEKYLIVFVGYTADDPPVQYLLEALNRRSGARNDIYAFQSGQSDYAESLWRHKGVRPLAYSPVDNHKALWKTLEAWSARALNPDSWYENIVELARKGPGRLRPHERGQITHLVSTVQGARTFASLGEPPPAEWLCVFDPQQRYATPTKNRGSGDEQIDFDPFESYGLDNDPTPPAPDPENPYSSRKVPVGVWDCFAPTRADRLDMQERHFASFRGLRAAGGSSLCSRLTWLSDWLAKVADQPTALWWAAGQISLHSDVRNRLWHELSNNIRYTAEVRQAWLHILDASGYAQHEIDHRQFQLMRIVERDGWTSAAIRELIQGVRPYLKATRKAKWKNEASGTDSSQWPSQIVSFKVEYPKLHDQLKVPDEMLPEAVRLLRENLEHAVRLDEESKGWGRIDIPPLEADPSLEGTSYSRNFGISIPLFLYLQMFKRLMKSQPGAAAREYLTWRTDENAVFLRLRIWGCLDRIIVSNLQVSELLSGMSDDVFWDSYHQRDLLLVLKERWFDLSPEAKTETERKLLAGPPHWRANDRESSERLAHSSLNRIYWLRDQGCEFGFDFEAETPCAEVAGAGVAI